MEKSNTHDKEITKALIDHITSSGPTDSKTVMECTSKNFYFHIFCKYLMFFLDRASHDPDKLRLFLNFTEEYLLDTYIEPM